MGNVGAWEIALIVLVLLLVFGPKRLPQMGRSLGRTAREFKESITGPAQEIMGPAREIKEAVDVPKQFKAALNPLAAAPEAPVQAAEPAPEAEAAPGAESLEAPVAEIVAEETVEAAPVAAEPAQPGAEKAEG